MSKVAIQGNALGTGTFTIAAPDSNNNNTLTLPDEAGTVVTTAGANFTGDLNAPTLDINNTGTVYGTQLNVKSTATTDTFTSSLASASGNPRWQFGAGVGSASGSSTDDKCVRSGLYFDSGYVAGTTFVRGGSATAGYITFDTDQTERMRIDSSGTVFVGGTNIDPAVNQTESLALRPFGRLSLNVGGSSAIRVGRTESDGQLVDFYQAGSQEGSISVSGTTVSYNGGHLARWSRLADDSKDTSIVKGTVMTNLDAMVVWSHDEVLWTADDELPDGVSVGDVRTAAYTEDNEQLNKMAVSSLEGDANVSGVFVSWDEDDDDFNDMNIAMTGDMVIRIAQGTTVARGDLLMSAGDGTAKPQGDDIVRSKTIAKVTSTNVSHTYDDGSYLVPCVLMAC